VLLSKRQGYILLIIMLTISLSTSLAGCIKEKEKYVLSPAVFDEENKAEAQKEASPKEEIVVHIKGEINKPGIYKLSRDSRLYELVEEAGGLTDRADIKNINLAIILRDQEDIYLPAIGEVVEGPQQQINQQRSPQQVANNKVRLNYASKEELKGLPGIGESIADRIIEYRNQKGSFKTIEEIKNVSGIGDKRFEDIKDRITVN